jgi:3-hydroxyacyl-CoA dehydrogenase/3-hydroxy-2-methylbutyryl-CoA dehydrogenase
MLRSVVAIVSGGASGLGAATANAIVRRGGRVLVADLPEASDNFFRLATATCAEVHHVGELAEGIACDYVPHDHDKKSRKRGTHEGVLMAFSEVDVRNEVDILNALDKTESTFGEPVNVVVNCAGISPSVKTISKPMEHSIKMQVHSLEEFRHALEVNTIGTFNLSRLSAERMARRKPDTEGLRGCIINTASIAAFEGQRGQVAYAASKGAITSMCLPLARDLAPCYGIRVCTIAPGIFKTPLLDGLSKKIQMELGKMVPCPNRLGHPDEFGRLAVSIIVNPMLNGEVIRLDGALRMQA